MPVCPNCSYEYVEGIVICPDCNMPLVDAAELKKYDELNEDDWVMVYSSSNEIDVEILKDNLESAGIGASMLSQRDHIIPAPGDLSVVKLMVKKSDVQAALNYMQVIEMQILESKVKKIIIDELGVMESQITAESSFTIDLGADALDIVRLFASFEETFQISIPDEDAEEIGSVGEAIKYLKDNYLKLLAQNKTLRRFL